MIGTFCLFQDFGDCTLTRSIPAPGSAVNEY